MSSGKLLFHLNDAGGVVVTGLLLAEKYRAIMQKLYVDPKAPVRTVIEKELEFKDEEPTEAPPAEEKPEAPSDNTLPSGTDPDPDPDSAPAPKRTFLQKAIHWLASLTEE